MINCDYLIEQANIVYAGYARQKENALYDKEKFYLENENYADVKYKLKACIFDLQKAKFTSSSNVGALEKEREALTAELKRIENSLPRFENEYSPRCKVCNDEGFANGKRCKCFYEKLNELAYETLGVYPHELHTFNDNAYNDAKTLKFVEKFKKYCSGFHIGSKDLMLLGLRGTGKTFFAEAIAYEINKSGKNALIINAFEFNEIFVKTMRANPREQLVTKDILVGCDLLVIDDLGAAPVLNKITAENLLMILSERQLRKKPFIITTNLSLDEIGERFGERVFSRACAKSTVKFLFEGRDLRLA